MTETRICGSHSPDNGGVVMLCTYPDRHEGPCSWHREDKRVEDKRWPSSHLEGKTER